jgi:hypothetical protein
MNDEPRDEHRQPPDEDTGAPVYALRALAVEPRVGFLSGIRNRIHRGVLAGDLADLSWKSWAQALLEYLAMIFGFISPSKGGPKDGDG